MQREKTVKLFEDRRGTAYPLRKTDNHMDMEEDEERDFWYNNNNKRKKQQQRTAKEMQSKEKN